MSYADVIVAGAGLAGLVASTELADAAAAAIAIRAARRFIGDRLLDGTFLGGCMFSGRVAGRAAGIAVG